MLKKFSVVPQSRLCVSAITQAELLYGITRHASPSHWGSFIHEFLQQVKILDWDSRVAEVYADLRAHAELNGKSLPAMDMLIAAHSLCEQAVLVTSDTAFYQFSDILDIEDWMKP